MLLYGTQFNVMLAFSVPDYRRVFYLRSDERNI